MEDAKAVYDSAWRILCYEYHEDDDPLKIKACSNMMKLADSNYPPALFYAISNCKKLLINPMPYLNSLLSIEDDGSGEVYFYTACSYLSLSDVERYREYSVKALECGYIHEYYQYRFDVKSYLDRLDPFNYNTLQRFSAFQSYKHVSANNRWADALISALESDIEKDIIHPRCLIYLSIFDLDRSDSVHEIIQKTLEKATILDLSRKELDCCLTLCSSDQKELRAILALKFLKYEYNREMVRDVFAGLIFDEGYSIKNQRLLDELLQRYSVVTIYEDLATSYYLPVSRRQEYVQKAIAAGSKKASHICAQIISDFELPYTELYRIQLLLSYDKFNYSTLKELIKLYESLTGCKPCDPVALALYRAQANDESQLTEDIFSEMKKLFISSSEESFESNTCDTVH